MSTNDPSPSTDSLSIRPASPEDAELVTAVLSASYRVLWRGHYSDADLETVLPLVTKAQPRLLASHRFFLVFAGDQIAGCGGWSKDLPGKPGHVIEGTGHIRHFGVDPAHLRKGIGHMIYRACLDQAVQAGIVRLEAWSSLQAVPFYQRLGFRIIEPFDVEMGRGVRLAAVRMLTDLR